MVGPQGPQSHHQLQGCGAAVTMTAEAMTMTEADPALDFILLVLPAIL